MARAATIDEAADARERILRAGLESFAENGYDGATTRSIATRAGVNLGLLPYYFGGKPKLWRAAVDLAFSELRGEIDAVLEDCDLRDDEEQMRRLIRAYVRFVARHPEFVRLMHDEGKRRGPRMRWLVDKHVGPLHDALTPLIERSCERGLLPADIDPVHFLYAMIGSIDVIFHQAEECKRLTGIDPADAAVADAHARAVEHLFLGPRSPDPS